MALNTINPNIPTFSQIYPLGGKMPAEKRKNRSSSSANNIIMTEANSNESVVPNTQSQPRMHSQSNVGLRTLKKTKKGSPQTAKTEVYTLDQMCSNVEVIAKLLTKYNQSLKYNGEVTQNPDIFDYLGDGIQSEI